MLTPPDAVPAVRSAEAPESPAPGAAVEAGPGSPVEPTPGSAVEAGPERRPFSAWDAVGMLFTAVAMLAVEQVIVTTAHLGLGHSGFVRAAAVLVGVLAVGWLLVLLVLDRPSVGSAVGRLAAVWRDPPGDWVAVVLGALLAVPLLRLYAPILFNDSDSSRVVGAVIHVQRHGIGYLRDTQDNLLPQLLLGPAIAVGGLAAAKLFVIASVQVLAGVTAYIARRITGSMWGAGAAAVALVALPPMIERTIYLPMYPTMLTLGYAGSWLAYRAVVTAALEGGGWRSWASWRSWRSWPSWRYAVPAGVCLALTPEAHAVGQLFYVVPLMLVVFAASLRSWLATVVRIYAVVFVVSLPRIAINLSEGGLSHFTSYRTDYWITKGYVREIQVKFWHYRGVGEPLGHYLRVLPERFKLSLGPWGWLLLALAAVAWLVWCRGRARWFVLGAVVFIALAVTIKRVPPFPRYYAPIIPGIALLIGVGMGRLAGVRWGSLAAVPSVASGPSGPSGRSLRSVRSLPWNFAGRVVAAVCTVALAAVAVANLDTAAHRVDRTRIAVEGGPYRQLVAAIDDDKGVIGARSHSLLYVTADVPTWGGQFLTEDEYVRYLTWPSDEQVIDVLERHDIGWVLIHAARALELSYHDTWLVPHHGRHARQVDAIAASPNFCPKLEAGGFVLYKLGPCGT
jgi:hypothetical protein